MTSTGPAQAPRFLEDYVVGRVVECGSVVVQAEEIVDAPRRLHFSRL